jgi:hypothetical protein
MTPSTILDPAGAAGQVIVQVMPGDGGPVAPSITTQPTDQIVLAGQSATFTAAASGDPAPTAQWQVSTDSGNTFNDIPGANSDNYTFTALALQDGDQFRAVYTNGAGMATTNAATLTIGSAPIITAQPPIYSYPLVGQTVTLTATASGIPAPAVQWQSAPDLFGTFTDIPGATSTTYSFTPTMPTQTIHIPCYRAVFTNAFGTATTSSAGVIVGTQPVIMTQPTDQGVYPGQTATFTAVASNWDSSIPWDRVMWQVSTDGGTTFSSYDSGTANGGTATLTVPATAGMDGDLLRAVFSTVAASATTNPARLTVYTAPVIVQQPTDFWVNGNWASFPPNPQVGPTLTVTCNGPFTVRWMYAIGTWYGSPMDIHSYNVGGTYTDGIAMRPWWYQNEGMQFQATVYNTAGSVTSNVVTEHVYYPPAYAALWGQGGSFSDRVNPTAAVGDTVSVYATCSGYGGPLTPLPTVQWLISTDHGQSFSSFTDGHSGYDDKGTWSNTFTATAAEDGALLRAVFTNIGGSATTNAITLTVNQVSSVSAAWGTSGNAALPVASDGLHLLPAGRSIDIPWMGINALAINLNHAVTLLSSDVSVKGVNLADYGPVTLSGSGTSYVITLAQPINAADRVTVTINNAALSFTGELDVLPGDVNDDGVVNAQDLVLIRNQIIGSGNSTIATFGDINGDGAVDMADFNLARQRIGTRLP